MRIALGLILCGGALRFMAEGWVRVQYIQPTYFFKYDFAPWAFVPGPVGLYALYGIIAFSALCVAAGFCYRFAALTLAFSFTYTQLLDVTNYLNHYYLVVLLAAWMVVIPLHRAYSVDAWLARRRGSPMPFEMPRVFLWLLRAQVALVFINAAFAKVSADWLLHAQPLGIWMAARTELPLIGGLLGFPAVVFAMSWGGFLYDLTIVFFLSWRRTRRFALPVVFCFHGLTHLFFDIGLFPFLMSALVFVFFPPHWPRRFRPRRFRPAGAPSPVPMRAPSRVLLVFIAAYLVVQVLVPLRHYAIPGDVLWTEEGMRFSWKVMVREKNGALTYLVTNRETGRVTHESPHDYLTWRQASEMSAQPDLIVQLAKHIAAEHARAGHDVEVRADSWASLNGRRRARLIDPSVDLARVDERIQPAPWITTMPLSDPLAVR